jgi:DNA-binding transcriptional LysR family regulator
MSFTRFTLRQIEAFLAVAELHSFSAAADRLGLTAQAISQLVAELESHLGFRLFDRTTRRVTLSSAGRDFWPSAQTLMRHIQGTESVADDVRHRAAGVLRVGAPLVLACTAVPEAIRAYQDRRPRVVVRIRDLAVDRLVDAVGAAEVDMAVGPDRATGSEVSSEAIFDSAWVLWCSPRHPLARRRRITWADLLSEPLVAAGYDHERSVAQMRLSVPEEYRVVPLDVVDNISTAMGVAARGRVATLAPAYVEVLASKFGLVMRRVVDPETVRKVCLYKPTARALSPAAEGFAEHLSIWLPKWADRRS